MARGAPTPDEAAAAAAQLQEKQKAVAFDTRDFTVGYLVERFRADEFYIPEYQREFVWNAKNRVRFIESMLLGLPIPFMFVADMEDGRLEIVDGAQRIRTLEQFLSDELRLSGLQQLSALNGFRFTHLPGSQQKRLENRPLRMIFLEETTSPELRQEIFNRINTSGQRARGMEIRRGAFTGPLMDFIKECSAENLFQKLCPVTKTLMLRREGEELALRFFAYSDEYREFKHDVDKFLDDFARRHRSEFDQTRMRAEFEATLRFVDEYFPPGGFARSPKARSTPRVRFEALAVGVNLALREKPGLKHPDLSWLTSDEFAQHTTTHASNSTTRLRGRIEYVRDQLLAS